MRTAILLSSLLMCALMCGCGGGGGGGSQTTTPVITWATPAAVIYGTALSATQLDATASVPGTFVYTPAAGTVLSIGSQTLSVTFTPTNTVNYTTATDKVTLMVNTPPPTITIATGGQTGAQNGAVIVTLASSITGAIIYYTVDGSTPTTSSQQYESPFLVWSSLTVNAIAVSASVSSSVTSQPFTPNIPSGTLVWSDEFTNSTGVPTQPNPLIWTYDTGAGGWGNNELETYCGWGSNTSPCSSATPSEYVNTYPGTDGVLYIEAQQVRPAPNPVYTSARMKTQGLFSFQYGRLEFRSLVPEAQGLWPANWLLGNNIATINWPACGEQDVLERVNAPGINGQPGTQDWNEGSIHGTGFTGGTGLGMQYLFPTGQTAGSAFHTYDMIWSPGSVLYSVDGNTYATFTPSSLTPLNDGAVWPFDAGQSNFIILNLAIGGDYPGKPDSTTPWPSEMLVDYVRIYTN